jgi:hypothetical protein
MKKLYFLFFVLAFFGCKGKDWKYKIRGEVEAKVKTTEWPLAPRYETKKRKAFWYTDEYRITNDTLVITNSDGSEWKIAPPYEIDSIK